MPPSVECELSILGTVWLFFHLLGYKFYSYAQLRLSRQEVKILIFKENLVKGMVISAPMSETVGPVERVQIHE